MVVTSLTSSASVMRRATEGTARSVSRKKSRTSPRRRLKKPGLETTPTLITPSGRGIIQNHPSSNRWMVMLPSSASPKGATPWKWP